MVGKWREMADNDWWTVLDGRTRNGGQYLIVSRGTGDTGASGTGEESNTPVNVSGECTIGWSNRTRRATCFLVNGWILVMVHIKKKSRITGPGCLTS